MIKPKPVLRDVDQRMWGVWHLSGSTQNACHDRYMALRSPYSVHIHFSSPPKKELFRHFVNCSCQIIPPLWHFGRTTPRKTRTNISYRMTGYPPRLVLERQDEYKLERANHHYFKTNVPTWLESLELFIYPQGKKNHMSRTIAMVSPGIF